MRHCLKSAGFDDRILADYVATVLTIFTQNEQRPQGASGDFQPSHPYIADMLIALHNADPIERFGIRVEVTNIALFLSGIFPKYVQVRVERRGAPDL